MSISKTIYERWTELRLAGSLDEVLPSARAYTALTTNGEVFGYDTRDYRVRRLVVLPGTGPTGSDGVVGLVETYFSVRHDKEWGPNLHVHLVEAQDEEIRVADVARLFRCIAGVRLSLNSLHIWELRQTLQALDRQVHVHGALLGPSASGDALMTEAMLEHGSEPITRGGQPMLRVGIVANRRGGGVLVKRAPQDTTYSSDDLFRSHGRDPQLRKAVSEMLDPLPMWAEWSAARVAEQDAAPPALHGAVERVRLHERRKASLRLLETLGITVSGADRQAFAACVSPERLDFLVDQRLAARGLAAPDPDDVDDDDEPAPTSRLH